MARQSKDSGSKASSSRRLPVEDIPEPASSEDDVSLEEDMPELEDADEEEEGVAQWAPDDWDEAGSDDGSGSNSDPSEDDQDEDADDLGALQRQMKSLPLSTLMKAQRSLQSQRGQRDESETDGSSSDTPGASGGPSTLKAKRLAEAKAKLAALQRKKGKATSVPSRLPDLEDEEGSEDEWEDLRQQKQGKGRGRDDEDGPKRERVKRDNRHAPTAISTKKQVSRNRQVIEQQNKSDRRDPRFDSMSSTAVSPHLQSQSYSFLPKLLKDELSALRTAVKMASKAEVNCPLSQKPARTAEREMLELQLGRLRTKIERGEREAKEREVLARVKKEENEKRSQGKGAWYMKKSEQKDVLLKARFENLEKKGGKSAVKKAMEKKRKKVAGKEKKSRPFAPGGGGGGGGGGGDGKRRRVA